MIQEVLIFFRKTPAARIPGVTPIAWILLLPCTPFPPVDAIAIPDCAAPAGNGTIRIGSAALRKLKFEEGLAVVTVGDGLFYVDRGGRAARVLPSDNGADEFVEDLARTVANGKVGFLDRRLRVVIRPRWDYAWPFQGGLAVVCNGCRAVADGEHRRMVGGLWGRIDRRGRAVVPVKYEKETLPGGP